MPLFLVGDDAHIVPEKYTVPSDIGGTVFYEIM